MGRLRKISVAEFNRERMRLPQFIVLTGAGISVRSPSNLPTGAQFRDALVLALLQAVSPDLSDVASALQSRPILRTRLAKLGMESMLQILSDRIGRRTLALLDVLKSTKPNPNHVALAQASWISAIFTLNFDRLQEVALRRARRKFKRCVIEEEYTNIAPLATEFSICKLHGSIEQPETIMATLRQLGRPLTSARHNHFISRLAGAPLLVLGYGGRDFDINAALRDSHPHIVYWLIRNPSKIDAEIAEVLRAKAGVLVAGNLEELFPSPVSAPPPSFSPPSSWKKLFHNRETELLGKVMEQLSAWELAEKCFKQVPALTTGGVTPAYLGVAYLDLGKQHLYRGEFKEAMQLFQQARTHASGSPDLMQLADCDRCIAETYRRIGKLKTAARVFSLAAQEYRDLTERAQQRQAQCGIGVLSARGLIGDYDADLGLQVGKQFAALGDPINQCIGLFHFGSILKWQGNLCKAEHVHTEQLRLARRYHILVQRAWALWALADVARLRRKNELAANLAKRAQRAFRGLHNGGGQAWCLELLAELARSQGQWKQMEALLEQLESSAGELVKIYILLNRADANRLQGRLVEAKDGFCQALVAAQKLGDCREILAGKLGLAEVNRLTNKPNTREVRRIINSCRKHKMTYWQVHASICCWLSDRAVGKVFDLRATREHCTANGYGYEIELLDSLPLTSTDWSYPLLFP